MFLSLHEGYTRYFEKCKYQQSVKVTMPSSVTLDIHVYVQCRKSTRHVLEINASFVVRVMENLFYCVWQLVTDTLLVE